jgi:hypothetical protein
MTNICQCPIKNISHLNYLLIGLKRKIAMSNTKCEDGSDISWWGATKSVFKVVGCGLNAAAKATEAAAIESRKKAEKAHDEVVINLVTTLKITHDDGSTVEDPVLAKLIADSYKEDDAENRKIAKIARVYNLDVSEFMIQQKRILEVKKLLDDF